MFDLLVIGAGPGGYTAAARAAKLGLSTAIVEERSWGGTCLNWGCVPTKTLLHASEVYRSAADGAAIGIHAEGLRADIPEIFAYKERISRQLCGGVESLLKGAGVALLRGRAVITAPGSVRVTGEDGGDYEARRILIATGSVPVRPPIPGLELAMTSDELLEGADHLYRSIVIIGGGVIGVEFATFYSDLGCSVTLLEGMDRLLPNMDRELGQNLALILKKQGVQVCTRSMVDRLEQTPEGIAVHYLGDAVALVCARDRETLEEAKKLVKVAYEVLPAVHDPEEAAAPDAPLVFEEEESNVQAYKHVSRGDAEGAIRRSKYVLTRHFHTPWTEHAFLEPECCVALPLENGGVKLLTTDQSSHTTMHECASMLGVDYEHCQVQNMLVGGGFGGKEDMSVQHHAALLAYVARVPVKVKLTRQESILIHPKRHSFDMDFTMGCDENGIIQGVKASVVSDTGAFASLGGPVLERACTHAAGPYAYENFEIEGRFL